MSIMITPLCHRGIRPQRKLGGVDQARRTCVGGPPPLHSPNQEEAAKLLMDVRSLALKELGSSSFSKPSNGIDLPKAPNPLQTAPQLPSTPTTRRSRVVSVCSMDEEDQHERTKTTIMIPTESSTTSKKPVCVSPVTPDPVRVPNNTQKLPQSLFLNTVSLGSATNKRSLLPLKRHATPYTPQQGKKLVGNTLPTGTQVRNVLRKKFSWKSFPELETYLIDHREQYLSFSSSLNYTKAQKLYNNHLTQDLLDLAAQHGYVFEGFTFAAIRDRIRCFYKSYVQAIKKKKKKKKSLKRGNGTKQQTRLPPHAASLIVS